MNIVSLYVKTHSVTKLRYFGKTIKSDVESYTGSGRYWLRHLAKYGKNFSTEIIATFDLDSQVNDLIKFCKKFSKENNIVESKDWANLIPEDGVNGWPVGRDRGKLMKPRSEEYRLKISKSKSGDKHPMWSKTHTPEAKEKIARASTGRLAPKTIEHRKKLSEANKGKRWWKNGSERKLQKECPGAGWVLGSFSLSNETKKKLSLAKTGKKMINRSENWGNGTRGKYWFTNGTDSLMAFECPEGYYKGRTLSKKS
jgi:hypothetical protein